MISRSLFAVLCLGLSTSSFAVGSYDYLVREISWAGTACPAGTTAVSNSQASFNGRTVAVAINDTAVNIRATCSITVDLKMPDASWAYGIIAASAQVSGDISASDNAQVYARIHQQGDANEVTLSQPLSGSFDHVNVALQSASPIWSPCGGGRSLTATIAALAPSRDSRLVLENQVALKIVYGRCR